MGSGGGGITTQQQQQQHKRGFFRRLSPYEGSVQRPDERSLPPQIRFVVVVVVVVVLRACSLSALKREVCAWLSVLACDVISLPYRWHAYDECISRAISCLVRCHVVTLSHTSTGTPEKDYWLWFHTRSSSWRVTPEAPGPMVSSHVAILVAADAAPEVRQRQGGENTLARNPADPPVLVWNGLPL